MVSTTQQQNRQPLQVDVQRVIEAESERWSAVFAQLVRENSVLRTALDDSQAEIDELRSKVMALGGMSGAQVPFPPAPRQSVPPPMSSAAPSTIAES